MKKTIKMGNDELIEIIEKFITKSNVPCKITYRKRDTGLYHNNGDKPAITCYNTYSKPTVEEYYIDGKRGRITDNPSIIYYDYKGGWVTREEYYINDILMRLDNTKPVIIEYKKDYKSFEVYHKDGHLYKSISYYQNGNINEIIYYKNDRIHRDNNEPAYITYSVSGTLISSEYYIEGEQYETNKKNPELKKLEITVIDILDDDCSICHSKDTNICYNCNSTGIIKIPCNHVFHYHCFKKWFSIRKSCPCCRDDYTNYTL